MTVIVFVLKFTSSTLICTNADFLNPVEMKSEKMHKSLLNNLSVDFSFMFANSLLISSSSKNVTSLFAFTLGLFAPSTGLLSVKPSSFKNIKNFLIADHFVAIILSPVLTISPFFSFVL